MVKPYLSRLRPAETGRRLRPRARSQFEPAPTFPVDGPSIGSLGLSLPPTGDAETADVEIELDQDPSFPHPAGPAVAAATPGDRGLPVARTATPERAAPDEERAPTHAAGAARPPRRGPAPAAPAIGDTEHDQDLSSPPPAGPAVAGTAGAQGLPPARTAVPERAPRPPRPSPTSAAAPASERGHRAPAGDEGDFRPVPAEAAGREHAPVPWSAIRRAAPQPRQAPPDQPLVPGASPGSLGAPATPPEAAPAEHPPPAPHRHVDRMSRSADGPADRVQAIARWLRDADAAAARLGAASPSTGPRPAPSGRARNWPGPTVDTEVTVTIGRIEVKAPAAAPAPARTQPGGPRRRVPSLGDYLESRTRVRGRLG